MKRKKALAIILAGTMAFGLFGSHVPANAAEPVYSTDYTITIPAALTVEKEGWNATTGITAKMENGDFFNAQKKISVTASSSNSWKLVSGTNSIGYNLATATGTYNSEAEPASWEFSATELNETNGTNKAMGIIVEDYSSKPAGTYQDTVTFTAKVETAKQLHSFTLTGPYSGDTLLVEFYDGDKWSDMVAKYSLITNPTREYVVFSSDGFIRKNNAMVVMTDTVEPNATYTVN